MIGLGKQRDGLYYLAALATKNSVNTSSSLTKQPTCNLTISSTDLWHHRLGHASSSRLSYIAKKFLNFSVQSNNTCLVCPLAKHIRLPFSPSTISSLKPFEIIHCDIWGRYRHPSLTGAHYFLTIVDDFTRFTWIFLMRHKDEAQSLLKKFFSFVQTQFESHIKTFRSDNSGEFTSLRSFFQDHGVVFQHSCVYTPQQNRVVERKHRHILQVARALKFQAQLPTLFWGECALTAVHIINRLPSPVLSLKTLFELLYSKRPSFSHLRVFGCLAYATNVRVSHKFDHHSIPSIFIGYPVGRKAYKLFDLSSNKIFTSRDVKFHETSFPYASVKPISPSPTVPGPIPLLARDIPWPNSFSPTPNASLSNTVTPPALPNPLPASPSSPFPKTPHTSPSPPSSPPPLSPNQSFLSSELPSLSSSSLAPSSEPSSIPPSHSPIPVPDSIPLRRSSRQTGPPIKLKDFVCNNVYSTQSTSLSLGPTKGTRHPLAKHLSYHIYMPQYKSFVAQLGIITEPRSYSEAIVHPEWQKAMNSELQALQANGTWTLTPLPAGHTPIGCR